MSAAVIVGYARTPIGRFLGGLSPLSAVDLGGLAITAALERAGVAPDQVEYTIMGHVIQAGQGQVTARQAARKAGIPMRSPALTVNMVCLSGMNAVHLADQTIRLGQYDVVVTGGMESMSNAPYLLSKARTGYRMGNGELVDAMIHDGLWDAYDREHMGSGNDRMAQRYGISRLAQDEWAAMSHERAVNAWKGGRFTGETVPVEVPQREGGPAVIDHDEGPRPDTSVELLSELASAFVKDGTTTAGNASQISDGSCALVLTSREKAKELGLTPLARIVAAGVVAGPDTSLHHQPAQAISQAASKTGRDPSRFDLYEINEAFAAVAIHSTKLLGVDRGKVNVNGGAVALGHPIGCTGARITAGIVHELRNRGGGVGAAALCGGGGQGYALILETL
ncbi:MAG: acetyl-CoA C-acetyltransferase [Egibacteraceae bacterium]